MDGMDSVRYVSRPIEIDAVQWTGENTNEVRDFVGVRDNGERGFLLSSEAFGNHEKPALVWDYLHATWVGVGVGDYIIRGTRGEYYPCNPEVFVAKYEPVEEERYEVFSDEGHEPVAVIRSGTITTSSLSDGGTKQPIQNRRF